MSEAGTGGAQQPEPVAGGRNIGPWGTTARAVVGLLGVYWALVPPHANPWFQLPGAGSRLWGVVIGGFAVPLVLTLLVMLRGRQAPAFRLGHIAALLVTVSWLVLLQFYPVAMMLLVAIPLLIQAVSGRAGCELLTIPNLLLRRDDYLFCLPFTPIDQWERHSKSS